VRYKVVPPVRSIAFLREASDQLPLVHGTVEDCCSRIRDGTALQSRDVAREYLTFCQALGLAGEADAGYYRPRESPEDEALAESVVERVYVAREALDAVDGGVRTPAAVFENGVEDCVPRWERDREDDWRGKWRERTERLLEWAVVFGLLDRIGDGEYARPGGS
jgi:hypothetical protein